MEYFCYTSDIIEAVKVMSAETNFKGVRFMGDRQGWKYEFHLDQARKDLHLSVDQYLTRELVIPYILGKLKDEDVPEPVKKIQAEIEDGYVRIKRYFNTISQLMNGVAIKSDVLKKYLREFYPDVEVPEKATVKQMSDFVVYGKKIPKPKVKKDGPKANKAGKKATKKTS